MRDHYGVEIDPKIYNRQAEQAIKTTIHQRNDEMGLSHRRETGNGEVTTIAVEPRTGDFKAELHTLQLELENAIDEHLGLLRENEMLKENSWEKRLELEYKNLSLDNASLQEDVERKYKEVMACERIIKILHAEITQRREEYIGW